MEKVSVLQQVDPLVEIWVDKRKNRFQKSWDMDWLRGILHDCQRTLNFPKTYHWTPFIHLPSPPYATSPTSPKSLCITLSLPTLTHTRLLSPMVIRNHWWRSVTTVWHFQACPWSPTVTHCRPWSDMFIYFILVPPLFLISAMSELAIYTLALVVILIFPSSDPC